MKHGVNLVSGELVEVDDQVFVATPRPGEGTVGIVVSNEAKVAIDASSYDGFAAAVKSRIDQDYAAPWKAVILTHSHFDHVGGAYVFGAPVYANEATRELMAIYTPEWLAENLERWTREGTLDPGLLDSPRIVMPGRTWGDRATLHEGSDTFEMVRLGGHSEDSSVVFVANRGVLFAGDLVFNGRLPPTTGADFPRWLDSLDVMDSMEPKLVIAGHGLPGGPELLEAQAAVIRQLLERDGG